MANTRQIFIVDDDPELRDALSEQLSLYEEFKAFAAEDGRKGVQAAKAGQIDLVIMDVGLPDIDGHEAVRILRKNGFKAPIIMLTGHDTDSDTILGLGSGADDYITKPFRFAVLLARIRAQLRQHETSEDAVFMIGPYAFRPGSKLLLNPRGSKVRLTEKESSILRYLYRAGQRPVSREKLLREVWGYNSEVTTHTLETHIYRLRQKIEREPPLRPCCSLKRAATNWCLDRRREDRPAAGERRTKAASAATPHPKLLAWPTRPPQGRTRSPARRVQDHCVPVNCLGARGRALRRWSHGIAALAGAGTPPAMVATRT